MDMRIHSMSGWPGMVSFLSQPLCAVGYPGAGLTAGLGGSSSFWHHASSASMLSWEGGRILDRPCSTSCTCNGSVPRAAFLSGVSSVLTTCAGHIISSSERIIHMAKLPDLLAGGSSDGHGIDIKVSGPFYLAQATPIRPVAQLGPKSSLDQSAMSSPPTLATSSPQESSNTIHMAELPDLLAGGSKDGHGIGVTISGSFCFGQATSMRSMAQLSAKCPFF